MTPTSFDTEIFTSTSSKSSEKSRGDARHTNRLESVPLTMEYLIRLIQIHETFRKPELEALAEIANIKMEFVFYSANVSNHDCSYHGFFYQFFVWAVNKYSEVCSQRVLLF